MGKYGTNLEGFGAYEGGVNADKGAPLVSTSSDGETALLFGPAALREIQAGVANGDFAIPPDAAGDTITASNPLPYWTFTDTSSSGAITCAVVADSTAASGNVLRWTVAAGTTTSKSAKITRFIAVPGSKDQAYSHIFEIAIGGGTNVTSRTVTASLQYYKQDLTTTTGTTASNSTPFRTSTGSLSAVSGVPTLIPSDAAYALLTISCDTTGTNASTSTIDIYEARVIVGQPAIMLANRDSTATTSAGAIWKQGNQVLITAATPASQFIGAGGDVSIGSGITGTTSVNQKFSVSYTSTFVQGVQMQSYLDLTGNTLSQYDKGGSADTTTITTAGTYYALTSAEASFTPQFVGQRWLLTMTGYASLNTTTIQYAFVRSDVTDASNVNITTLGYSRSENFGTSGRGGTVAFTKVWVADRTTACKFKLYGTTQTTNGLVLSLAYTQMTAYPIG